MRRARRRANFRSPATFVWAKGRIRCCRADAAMRIPDRGHRCRPEPMPSCQSKTCVSTGDAVSIVEAPVAAGDERHRARRRHAPRRDGVCRPGRRIRARRRSACSRRSASTDVPVYRRPVVAVFSSGDELVAPRRRPARRTDPRLQSLCHRRVAASDGRDSRVTIRRCATKRTSFEAALDGALDECDAVVITGGSSVGERDRLPRRRRRGRATRRRRARIAYQAGKADAAGGGTAPSRSSACRATPTSALMVLEAVAAPIVAALTARRSAAATVSAHVGAARPKPRRTGRGTSRWPAARMMAECLLAHPLPLRSFSVSLTARADGYVVMDERDEEWPAGTLVTVHRFLGG